MDKNYVKKPEGAIERDLNYMPRGRGLELGDALPGSTDFKGDGNPEDNSQDHDVQGEGYNKSGTWQSGATGSIKSDKQP